MIAPVFGSAATGCSLLRSTTFVLFSSTLLFSLSFKMYWLPWCMLAWLCYPSDPHDLSSSSCIFHPPPLAGSSSDYFGGPSRPRRRRGRRGGIQVKLRLTWRRGLAGKRRRARLVSCAQKSSMERDLFSTSLFGYTGPGSLRPCCLRRVYPDSPAGWLFIRSVSGFYERDAQTLCTYVL